MYDHWYDNSMRVKKIKDNQYPIYSFRLDPETIVRLAEIKEKDSWNKLFIKLLEKYETTLN